MPYRYMLLMMGVDREENKRRMKAKRVRTGVSQPKIILGEGGREVVRGNAREEG
jgi:hypothetical protein